MNKSEQLIACLEGEIAKRDGRIAELHNDASYYAARNEELRAELAAIKAQEPVTNDESGLEAWAAGKFGFGGAFRGELCGNTDWALARLVWSAALAYAAPVSEAKAQAVVMPEQDGSDAQIAFWAGFEFAVCGLHNGNIRAAWNDFKGSEQFKRLNAAPAAPAADAGLVEALELAANRLDRLALEQGEFWRGYATAWADEARATANGVKS